jgi:protein arginine kinase activator
MTPPEFQKKGKMGCPKCYEYYKNDLPEILAGCQDGGVKHVGKQPKTPSGDPAELLKVYKLKLKHAIEHEKYEEAAKLKQKVKFLEAKLPKAEKKDAQEDHLGGTDGCGPGGTVGSEDCGDSNGGNSTEGVDD